MLLDFQAVQAGRSTQAFTVTPDDPVLEGLFGRLTRPLEVTARVREQPHRSFLVELHVSGEVETHCRRCLATVPQRIDERTALLAEVRDRDAAPEEEGEEDEHAVLALRSLHDRVDIGPAVRDVLFLAAEPYALCRPDCRGLCPRCGQDLNAGDCDCPPDEVPEHGRGAAIRITGV